ncbi:hypothetical protein [Anaerotignum sp. MB30-C6]|uniref:hypothetical protein n=1 Tax=Anaerotignum sp. MB30-C6 TaxID=3070814 RepID=UPI0027DCA683|nr:hypothetical protein [Anaerotignum sp. MB30-C6]WMI80922.1 hypothetical protein RBQ60_14045 [Anaerotignum sp. MB30-C6]
MSKYIDAEIAENSLRQYAEQKHANGEIELANGILKAVCKLRTLPSADVKEVVRGNKVAMDWVCSECESYIADDDSVCPSCGAEMGVE